MSLARVQILAAKTVSAVENGQNLSDEIARIWAQNMDLTAQEKGMLQDIAYGCQRFSGSLKFMLNQMLNQPLTNKNVHDLLLVALYQLNHTRNATHAVVNEAVNNVARIQHGKYRALSNALLRRFLREKESLNRACQHDEVAKYNLPAWWQKKLQAQYPKHWHNIITAFQSHPPLTLRVNRRHMNAEQYAEILRAHNISAKILGEYAIRIERPMPVNQLPRFADGAVSVQDWGAQQAITLLNPQHGERILDACAAPGGKTGHILEWADCELTALDIDSARLTRVVDNLTRLQLQAEVRCAAAEDVSQWWNGQAFDAILADIPCTASGTVKRNPDIKWLRRPSDPLKTAQQQRALLDALWQTLRTGGRLLLTTCSIFDEENAMQCQAFLQRHADAHLREQHTLLPNDKQDGFYYALIEKQ